WMGGGVGGARVGYLTRRSSNSSPLFRVRSVVSRRCSMPPMPGERPRSSWRNSPSSIRTTPWFGRRSGERLLIISPGSTHISGRTRSTTPWMSSSPKTSSPSGSTAPSAQSTRFAAGDPGYSSRDQCACAIVDGDRLRPGKVDVTSTYRPIGACLDVGFFQNVLVDATMILPRAVFTEGGAFSIGREFRVACSRSYRGVARGAGAYNGDGGRPHARGAPWRR